MLKNYSMILGKPLKKIVVDIFLRHDLSYCNMLPPSIPRQENIDMAAFVKTLNHADASYKFFWLLALLKVLKERQFNSNLQISFSEIIFVMLKHAKAPIRRFNLSFGARDKLHEILEDMERQTGKDLWDSRNTIPESPDFDRARDMLSRYVPYRWIRPFVERETKGAGGNTRNQRNINSTIVDALITKSDSKTPPPYIINPADGYIKVHSLWAEYFSRNTEIVKGWCLWHLANFIQVRNPNIPAIIGKLAVTDNNSIRQLAEQRKFWSEIIPVIGGMKCIYSCRNLTVDRFELDHYVPWSFVGHDNMWNLIPSHPSVNSSKRDNLPDCRYLDAMINAHHCALVARENFFKRKWGKLLESYIADLKLPISDLTDKNKLHGAYHSFIPPLIDLAKANRFKADWVYRSKTPLLENGN